MNKLLFCLIFLMIGCNETAMSAKDLIISESFIAMSVAANAKNLINDNVVSDCKCNGSKKELSGDSLMRVQCRCGENCQCSKMMTPKSDSIFPKKYLRLLSAKEGCSPCKQQDNILKGSDWIIREGSEEQNKDKRPYHGIKESVESLNDGNNELWKKYNTNTVPHWQLVIDGKVVKTYSGVMSLSELRAFFLNGDEE